MEELRMKLTEKPFNRFKKVLFFCGLGGLLAFSTAGCNLFPKEEPVLAPPLIKPQEVKYDVVEVKKGNIEKTITANATFVSADLAEAFFQYRGGRLKKIYVKSGDEVKKGTLLAELDTDSLSSQISQQKIVVTKAEVSYRKVKETGGDEYALKQAKLDIDLAKAKLSELQKEYSKARLTAPMSGKVVYVADVNPGDYVDAYKTLVRIADPENLKLQYTGDRAMDFQLGMEVLVKIKDKEYKGEVILTPTSAPQDRDESLKNVVLIEVKNLPDGEVKMSQDARIVVTLEKKENVIVIPRQLVQNYLGRKYVQVLEDGLKKERDVETGLETTTDVEILKGLQEGDQVIER